MDKTKAQVIGTILVVIGAIFILMMAFNAVPGKGNTFLFIGLVCFVLTGVVRAILRK